MKSIKHIGRIKGTGSKVLIVFRTLPGESDHALVLPVGSLTPDQHDSIIKLVETPQAQDAFEFGEMMFIRAFPEGQPMLTYCQRNNLLAKVQTDKIIVTPNTVDEVLLSELNVLIAEQKNCAVDDLYTFVSGATRKTEATVTEITRSQEVKSTAELATLPSNESVLTSDEPLSDKDLAKQFRSQADSLYKEAARLRKQAEEIDPVVKKASKVKEDQGA
jgi:hypothetical protein